MRLFGIDRPRPHVFARAFSSATPGALEISRAGAARGCPQMCEGRTKIVVRGHSAVHTPWCTHYFAAFRPSSAGLMRAVTRRPAQARRAAAVFFAATRRLARSVLHTRFVIQRPIRGKQSAVHRHFARLRDPRRLTHCLRLLHREKLCTHPHRTSKPPYPRSQRYPLARAGSSCSSA